MAPAIPPVAPASASRWSRRGLLKRGLLGGALLALGGGSWLALRGTKEASVPPEGLLVLSSREYAVVGALALRLVPLRSGWPSPEDVRVAFNVDRILVRADEGVRRDVKALLALFENALAGFIFAGETAPFTRLSPEAQDARLRGWQESRLALRRTGFEALRALCMAAYYGSPLTWQSLGYLGPPAGFHQPDAPVWKGAGPRSEGLDVSQPPAEATHE